MKQYRRSLEVSMGSDYWVRQQSRLYDPDSLKVIENKDGLEVISFRYDKTTVPTTQRWSHLVPPTATPFAGPRLPCPGQENNPIPGRAGKEYPIR